LDLRVLTFHLYMFVQVSLLKLVLALGALDLVFTAIEVQMMVHESPLYRDFTAVANLVHGLALLFLVISDAALRNLLLAVAAGD
jgi:hypothetical protein